MLQSGETKLLSNTLPIGTAEEAEGEQTVGGAIGSRTLTAESFPFHGVRVHENGCDSGASVHHL